jgi:hypothetical protein
MNRWTKIVVATAMVAAGAWPCARAAEIRYPEVLYLDEIGQPPLELRVKVRTPILFSRDPRSVIAYLSVGQRVQVLGVGRDVYFAVGRIVTGLAKGWVYKDDLEPASEEVVAEWNKRRERLAKHRELIARKEIAIGMTHNEVEASLGRPERKARIQSRDGEHEQWYYITYQYIPQYHQYYDVNGELRQLVSYQRVPAGQKVVTFVDNEVVEIADQTENRQRPPAVIIIPQAPEVSY